MKNNNKYQLSFAEEYGCEIRNKIAGRIEVYIKDKDYPIEEIRFFTRDSSFFELMNELDGEEVSEEVLNRLKKKVKEKYYDKN